MELQSINIRDPFVLPYNGVYYLYGTNGYHGTSFDVYESTNLIHWSAPQQVFSVSDAFWGTKDFWAPEVHRYNGAFYMFASFKAEGKHRGTQILKADSPKGPFHVHSPEPVTPWEHECLDGTLYVEDGIPYLIYCHEWVELRNGTICARRLSADLTHAVAEPKILFHAADAPCVKPIDTDGYVTDGPFFIRSGHELFLTWSSMAADGYCVLVAKSDNGRLDGRWNHMPQPLYTDDGGHSMLFRAFDGTVYLSLHAPNTTGAEHPLFLKAAVSSQGIQLIK